MRLRIRYKEKFLIATLSGHSLRHMMKELGEKKNQVRRMAATRKMNVMTQLLVDVDFLSGIAEPHSGENELKDANSRERWLQKW